MAHDRHPLRILGRPPASLQNLVLWAWLRWREQDGPTRLPERTYIARCLRVDRKTVRVAMRRLCRTEPPLLALTYTGRGKSRKTFYQTLDLAGQDVPPARDPMPRDTRKPAPPACGTSPHKEENRNDSKEREREHNDTSASEFSENLTDDQRRLLGYAFPFGYTVNQFRRLMQAVVWAERLGVPDSFLAYALAAVLDEEEEAPWDLAQRHVGFLREDARRCSIKWQRPLQQIPAFRTFLEANVNDPAVREWVGEFPGRRVRCNFLFVWPKAPTDRA